MKISVKDANFILNARKNKKRHYLMHWELTETGCGYKLTGKPRKWFIAIATIPAAIILFFCCMCDGGICEYPAELSSLWCPYSTLGLPLMGSLDAEKSCDTRYYRMYQIFNEGGE